jgi:phosphate/sulfate permease
MIGCRTPAIEAGPYVAEELLRVWRAMMLAARVEVCDALLRGESVPLETLDPGWVKRLGMKP